MVLRVVDLDDVDEDPDVRILWLMAPDVDELPDLASLIDRPAWMARAACRGEPPTTFFPARGGTWKRARELCAGCTVREECRAYARADPELRGWWGGESESARAEGSAP